MKINRDVVICNCTCYAYQLFIQLDVSKPTSTPLNFVKENENKSKMQMSHVYPIRHVFTVDFNLHSFSALVIPQQGACTF